MRTKAELEEALQVAEWTAGKNRDSALAQRVRAEKAESQCRDLDYQRKCAERERDAARAELAQAHRALVRLVLR